MYTMFSFIDNYMSNTPTRGGKILKERYITFSFQRGFEPNNEFWIDMRVYIYIPNNIVLWTLNVIHPIIILITTWTNLITIRTKKLHIPHYDTA